MPDAFFKAQQGRYVSAAVKIEFGARSDLWHAHSAVIPPITAKQFPQAFDAPECTVRALVPESSQSPYGNLSRPDLFLHLNV